MTQQEYAHGGSINLKMMFSVAALPNYLCGVGAKAAVMVGVIWLNPVVVGGTQHNMTLLYITRSLVC